MRPLLSRPYHLDTSVRHHIRMALYFGGFVFLFLLVFKPFGLIHLGDRLPLVTMGYGAVCTVAMLLLNVVLARLLRGWFDEQRWTVGRELAWSALNVAIIGVGNALYTAAIGLAAWNVATIGTFTLFTLAVGLFPIALSVVLNEARLNRDHVRRSDGINKALQQQPRKAPASATNGMIRIPSENSAEDLELESGMLHAIRAADNYLEVYHERDGRMERTVLRGSLKAAEEALAGGDRYLRCHKSHLVDLQKVRRVSGNAQGLKLHLDGIEEPVPVSRQLTAVVRERLAVRP
jgi:hypothetical protein